MAHVPLQLIQGDVCDRDAVLSPPVDFKHFLFQEFFFFLHFFFLVPYSSAFRGCSGPSADGRRKKGAIKSNGTGCIYVFLMGTRGKDLGKKMMDSSSQRGFDIL